MQNDLAALPSDGLDPVVIQSLLHALKEAYLLGGWLAVLPVALTWSVNIYRMPWVQRRLPLHLRWDALPLMAQLGLIFLFSFAGGVVTHLAGGMSLATAAWTALGVGIAAIASHHFVLRPIGKSEIVTQAAAGLPKNAARALSIVVPLDMNRVRAARVNGTAVKQ